MATVELPDEQWSKILQFLRGCPDVYVSQETHCRSFIEGVLWVARSGAQWRLLPEKYGKWNSIYQRFARWCDRGIWERMHHHFADDPDLEHLIIDSTVVRAPPALLEPPKKRRSRGAGSGPEPRRVQHQNPRERGCLGQSVVLQADRRPKP